MKRVVIESPLRGDRERNKFYARLCMLDCLRRGEAPYASHLLFDHPDLLDDTKREERELGMMAGFAWGCKADLCAVYEDLTIVTGWSSGMRAGVESAKDFGISVEARVLPKDLYDRFAERYPEVVAKILGSLLEPDPTSAD